jgi:outer membrane autotransporter protein
MKFFPCLVAGFAVIAAWPAVAADDTVSGPALRGWSASYLGSSDYTGLGGGLTATRYGVSLGSDMEWDNGWLAGGSVSAGYQHFSAPLSSGNSRDLFLGLYGRKTFWEGGYITGSALLGWHDIDITRQAIFELEHGQVTSREIGGRLEAGYRWWWPETVYSVAPFFAIGAERFHTPAYSETPLSSTGFFPLDYAAHDSDIGHTELGFRLGRNFVTDTGALWLEGTAGWSHELDSTPFAQTAFPGLGGTGFAVSAILPARETALLGLNIQAQKASGFSYGARFDTEVGGNTTVLSGTGNIAWRW